MQLAKELNCELQVKDIFESKSLKELLKKVCHEDIQDEGADKFRASYFQEQMWIIQNMMPSSGDYNVYYAFEIHEKVDSQKLLESLQQVHAKNDILQSRFEEEDVRERYHLSGYTPQSEYKCLLDCFWHIQ